jgi:hypothetical protein
MEYAFSTFQIACLVAGLVLYLYAYRERTESCPDMPSWNPKHWKPVWMMKDWFSPKGYRLNLVGSGLICLAGISALLRWWLV